MLDDRNRVSHDGTILHFPTTRISREVMHASKAPEQNATTSGTTLSTLPCTSLAPLELGGPVTRLAGSGRRMIGWGKDWAHGDRLVAVISERARTSLTRNSRCLDPSTTKAMCAWRISNSGMWAAAMQRPGRSSFYIEVRSCAPRPDRRYQMLTHKAMVATLVATCVSVVACSSAQQTLLCHSQPVKSRCMASSPGHAKEKEERRGRGGEW